MAYGLQAATSLLELAHAHQRLAHAYLVSGPENAGKRELAVKLIEMLQGGGENGTCELDGMESETVRILRPESKSRRIKIEQIRELEHALHMTAARRGEWKIAVIVDAERMMPQAQNAFLKTLEEPPEDCLLLLLSDAPEELLETIRSRCLRVVLQGDGAAHLNSPDANELLGMLDAYFRSETPCIAQALAFSRSLGERLKAIKKRMEKNAESDFKEEAAALKNRIEGDYLDRREKASEASAQASYLGERARLVDVLVSWFGDAVRQQYGYGRLDLPKFAATTASMAQRYAPADLMKRLTSVEEFRDLLGTNVQESLALDVSMIGALG